jgi:hypothetical protein
MSLDSARVWGVRSQGWWLNSLIVFVIPLDVSSSLYYMCVKNPNSTGADCGALLKNPPIFSYLDPTADGE